VNEQQKWPAVDDPWWRFTPRNVGTGYLSLAAAVLLLIWSGVDLANGDLDRGRIILNVVIAVLGLLMLIRSVTGLQKLHRRKAG
jgi:hypothetical protein